MDKIALSDMLDYVATELLTAQQKALSRGHAVMQFSECAISCAVEVEKGGSGGIKVWVLEVSGDVKKTEQNTISVKFNSIPNQPVLAVD